MFTAISYDSAETGAVQLRCDNIVHVFERIKSCKRTPIGEYAFAYDSIGKMKEPLFDGYAVGISLLPDDVFDANFAYIPVEYRDAPRTKKRVSGLSTSYTDTPCQRKDIDYHTFNHVFVMGPLTKTFMDYLDTIHEPTMFHIQGEAPGETNSTTSYPSPLTHNGGIFPCSFNQWTSEDLWRLFRSKMNRRFTVKCKSTDLVNVETKSNKTMESITVQIPRIYVQLRDYMVDHILLGLKSDFVFNPLRIVAIFQDMIDKDNLVSCAMLLQHAVDIPYLSLIGRRVHDYQPCPLSTYNFREFEESEGELQYPSGNPNGPFNLEKTMQNHLQAVTGFRERLPYTFSYSNPSENDIADGVSTVSESERAPFAEGIVARVDFMK